MQKSRFLHALLHWRPYLVDISYDFKTDFFCIGTLCVFVVNDRWNSYFVVLLGVGRNVKYYLRTHYYSSGGVKEQSERI